MKSKKNALIKQLYKNSSFIVLSLEKYVKGGQKQTNKPSYINKSVNKSTCLISKIYISTNLN